MTMMQNVSMRYLDMMNQWLILKQEGKSITSYIRKQGWQTIAIYGMGIYGRHVIRELKGTDCIIKYGVDQKTMDKYDGIEIMKPIEKLPEVDVIVNTVIHDHASIANDLKGKVLCSIVNLEDIIFSSY